MAEEEWASYLPDLAACLLATKGPVLEVGAGAWSTPMLAAFCRAARRPFVSIDEDHAFCRDPTRWANYSVELPNLALEKWSVVLLDHSPGWRRPADAMLFRDSAEFIVSHDYAGEQEEGYAPLLGHWRHRRVSSTFSPKTLVLSATQRIPR